MSIKINFYDDWIEMLRDELRNTGVTLQSTVDKDAIPFIYFNCQKRIIPRRVREIAVSDVFECPANLRSGLFKLEKKIRAGDDLTPHLSRLVLKRYDSKDYLLNDWGIHHLHLGEVIEDDGFVTRTGPVLYCKVSDGCAYFIDVREHGKWNEQELLRIIYGNWKEILDPVGVMGTRHHPTDDEIGALRKGNINTLLEIEPGVVIISPGGGYASDGTSIEVVFARDKAIKYLQEFQTKITQNEEDIRRKIEEKTTAASELCFKLKYIGGRFVAHELDSDTYFG